MVSPGAISRTAARPTARTPANRRAGAAVRADRRGGQGGRRRHHRRGPQRPHGPGALYWCDHARNHVSHQRPSAVWPRSGRGQPAAGRGPDRPLGARCPPAGSRSAAAGLRVRGRHHDQRRARAPGVCAGGDGPAECALRRPLSTAAAGRAPGRGRVLEGALGDRMTNPNYDTDFYAWAEAQAAALRAKDWARPGPEPPDRGGGGLGGPSSRRPRQRAEAAARAPVEMALSADASQ